MGAEVIKVESHAHPDNLRLSGPPGRRQALEGSGYFALGNTCKKSLAAEHDRRRGARIAAVPRAAPSSPTTSVPA